MYSKEILEASGLIEVGKTDSGAQMYCGIADHWNKADALFSNNKMPDPNERITELFERIHAEAIEIVYLKYKHKPHDLGAFKEEVKAKLHNALKK